MNPSTCGRAGAWRHARAGASRGVLIRCLPVCLCACLPACCLQLRVRGDAAEWGGAVPRQHGARAATPHLQGAHVHPAQRNAPAVDAERCVRCCAQTCGTPSEAVWPGVSKLPWLGTVGLANYPRILRARFQSMCAPALIVLSSRLLCRLLSLCSVLPLLLSLSARRSAADQCACVSRACSCTPEAFSLLDALLSLDPRKRPTARQVRCAPEASTLTHGGATLAGAATPVLPGGSPANGAGAVSSPPPLAAPPASPCVARRHPVYATSLHEYEAKQRPKPVGAPNALPGGLPSSSGSDGDSGTGSGSGSSGSKES